MNGVINGGTMTVTLNINHEKLYSPQGHWLPCEVCHTLQEVPLPVVSLVCEHCAKDPDDEKTIFEICTDCPPKGYPTDKTRCSDCPIT